MKFSTAKSILYIFRHEGRIGKKKTRIKQRQNKQRRQQKVDIQKKSKNIDVITVKKEEHQQNNVFQGRFLKREKLDLSFRRNC